MTDTLSIRDNRTGQEYDIPISDGTIRAADLKQIALDDEPGLATYDPGFVNTASCRSSITYIDGDVGILEYRGYPIEQLAEHSSFLEVSYLLLYGELPTRDQLDTWVHEVTYHTFLHENLKQFIQGFRYDAHPMGMLMASVSALSTFYPDGRKIKDPDNRKMQITRLIAKMPTLGAFAFRHVQGKPYVYLDQRGTVRWLGRGRPLLRRCRRNRRPLRTAARRGERRSAQDAQTGPLDRQRSRLHRGCEGRQREADGLRSSCLQELRSAGQDHQEGLRRRVRGHRRQPAAQGCPGTGEDRP